MRIINFYKSESGNSPVEEFLDSLSAKQAQKIVWVLKLIQELEIVPRQYFKKLISTNDLWQVRVQIANGTVRIICFFDGNNVIILSHAFLKKTQKLPSKDIKIAEQRKRDYFRRKNNG
jgi:phage-related protein